MRLTKLMFIIYEALPMVNRRQVVKFFTSHGFVNKGGTRHDRYEHPDGRWTVIERHKEINDRLFELMKKQAGLK